MKNNQFLSLLDHFDKTVLQQAADLMKSNSFIYSLTVTREEISMRFWLDYQNYETFVRFVYDFPSDSFRLTHAGCNKCNDDGCKHIVVNIIAYFARMNKANISDVIKIVEKFIEEGDGYMPVDQERIQSLLNCECIFLDGYIKYRYGHISQSDIVQFFDNKIYSTTKGFNRSEMMYAVEFIASTSKCFKGDSYNYDDKEKVFLKYFSKFILSQHFSVDEIHKIFTNVFSSKLFKDYKYSNVGLVELFVGCEEEVPLREAFVESIKGKGVSMELLNDFASMAPKFSNMTPVSFYVLYLDEIENFSKRERITPERAQRLFSMDEMYEYALWSKDTDVICRTVSFFAENLLLSLDKKLLASSLDILLSLQPGKKDEISRIVLHIYEDRNLTIDDYMKFLKYVNVDQLDDVISKRTYKNDIARFHNLYTKHKLNDKFKVTMFSYREYAYLASAIPDENIEAVKKRMTSRIEKIVKSPSLTKSLGDDLIDCLKFLDQRFPSLCASYLMDKKIETLLSKGEWQEEYLLLANRNNAIGRLGYSRYGG